MGERIKEKTKRLGIEIDSVEGWRRERVRKRETGGRRETTE